MRTRKAASKASSPTILSRASNVAVTLCIWRQPLLLSSVHLPHPLPVMSCLDELNDRVLRDNNDSWTEEKLDAVMFPPGPSCLDTQAMPTLKPTPAVWPTINQLHSKLINGCDNLFFIAFKNKWRLVGVAYKAIMSLHPDCLQGGTFLVDFYIIHPTDY